MLIANRKYKLAVAAKAANWGLNFFCSFLLNEKFCVFSRLSSLSGLVPNYGGGGVWW